MNSDMTKLYKPLGDVYIIITYFRRLYFREFGIGILRGT